MRGCAHLARVALGLAAILLPPACAPVQPHEPAPLASQVGAPPEPTAATRQAERLARLRRLADVAGTPPDISEIVAQVAASDGTVRAEPVIRLVFPERVFFDTAQDQPKPDSLPVLDLLAEEMRRDAPGTQMTVVGHTDAVGGDNYNLDLSRRRAAGIVAALQVRGVGPEQLAAVPMGKNQPVASNTTADGRARNRRVEFFVSSDLQANEAAIAATPVQAEWLRVPGAPRPVYAATAVVLRPELPASGGAGGASWQPVGNVALHPAPPLATLPGAPVSSVVPIRQSVRPAMPTPAPLIQPRTPDPISPAPFGTFRLN